MARIARVSSLLLALTLLTSAPVPAQEGGLRYTVSVVDFENEAGWSGQWDVGNAWGTVFTDVLNQTGSFIVLGESEMRGAALSEQEFAASGATVQGDKTPQQGQMTPAQILVRGAITHIQHDTSNRSGGVRVGGLRVGGGGGESEISMTIYMVDSTTGQVIASQSVTGTSKSRGLGVGFSSGNWGAAFGGNENDNLGKAITDAASQAAGWLTEQLPGVTWRGSVVMVRDGQVYINRGTREGVSSGQQFVVGGTEVIRDPSTGEVLDEFVSEIATIQCNTVREKLSICSVVSGDAGAVAQGQGVMMQAR